MDGYFGVYCEYMEPYREDLSFQVEVLGVVIITQRILDVWNALIDMFLLQTIALGQQFLEGKSRFIRKLNMIHQLNKQSPILDPFGMRWLKGRDAHEHHRLILIAHISNPIDYLLLIYAIRSHGYKRSCVYGFILLEGHIGRYLQHVFMEQIKKISDKGFMFVIIQSLYVGIYDGLLYLFYQVHEFKVSAIYIFPQRITHDRPLDIVLHEGLLSNFVLDVLSIIKSNFFGELLSLFAQLIHHRLLYINQLLIYINLFEYQYQKMQNAKNQQILKIIIIGDCGVGKSNLLIRYCQDHFKPSYVATIGVDFRIKTITVKDKRVKLQIWDTAGQQRYKNMTQAYYKNAAAIIMIYSITQPKTFQSIERWMDQVNEHAPSDVIKMLIGNKVDMESERAVHQRQGQALANRYNMPFLQVSAMNGKNVVDMFVTVGEKLIDEYLPNRRQQKARYSLTSNAYSAQQKKYKQCQC